MLCQGAANTYRYLLDTEFKSEFGIMTGSQALEHGWHSEPVLAGTVGPMVWISEALGLLAPTGGLAFSARLLILPVPRGW